MWWAIFILFCLLHTDITIVRRQCMCCRMVQRRCSRRLIKATLRLFKNFSSIDQASACCRYIYYTSVVMRCVSIYYCSLNTTPASRSFYSWKILTFHLRKVAHMASEACYRGFTMCRLGWTLVVVHHCCDYSSLLWPCWLTCVFRTARVHCTPRACLVISKSWRNLFKPVPMSTWRIRSVQLVSVALHESVMLFSQQFFCHKIDCALSQETHRFITETFRQVHMSFWCCVCL